MKIKVLSRQDAILLLKENPNLLDKHYLITVSDLYSEMGQPQKALDDLKNYRHKLVGPLHPPHEHYYYTQFADCEYKLNFYTLPMSKKQAVEIIKFLEKIKPKHDTVLYINCLAGVNRSGSIGRFAREYFQVPYQEFKEMNPQIIGNTHVYSTLKNEYNKMLKKKNLN